MGFPMAGHLHKAGHNVTVYNRTASKSKKWVNEYGGASAKTPGHAAQGADFVMACVGNDNDLQTICTGPDGAFATMHSGAIFVDHTTVSAKITRDLYESAAKTGVGFVDAPVSGGQAGAENGQLGILTYLLYS
jgi:3-hydroxyisobutyrate dehydrogenase